MHAFIELWNAKPAWLALSEEERGRYMEGVSEGMAQLAAAGVEALGWGCNDDPSEQRAPYEFFAVWRTPGPEVLATFQDAVRSAGWYDYFEQANVSGELEEPPAVIARHVEMPQPERSR